LRELEVGSISVNEAKKRILDFPVKFLFLYKPEVYKR
jgi:hypothetical protein